MQKKKRKNKNNNPKQKNKKTKDNDNYARYTSHPSHRQKEMEESYRKKRRKQTAHQTQLAGKPTKCTRNHHVFSKNRSTTNKTQLQGRKRIRAHTEND